MPVLVVDHNPTSRRTLEEWLRGWGAEPTTVGDGPSALEALRRAAAAGRPYGLVVLDLASPGPASGSSSTRLLQLPGRLATAALFLIVDDQAKEVAKCDEVEPSLCLMKPVQEEELLDAVCGVLSLPRPAVPAGDGRPVAAEQRDNGRAASTALPPLHVLVAEDNPFNQMVVEDLLHRHGHTVRVVGDGRAALAALEQEEFDALLLDVHMPELDGFQVVAARRRRERGTGRRLPIVALTARLGDGERERCLEAGMDDYLAKPIRAADLLAALRRVLSGGGDSRQVRQDAAGPKELLDSSTLLAACGGDAELLNKMCRYFQAQAPDRLAEVSEALKDRNASRLREAAHKLGGMVSAFSAPAAGAAALLEQTAAEGDLEEATGTLPPVG